MSPPIPTEIPLISPPIWADFNSLDRQGRVRLGKPGTQKDLARYGVTLVEGLPVLAFDYDGNDQDETDDLLAIGIAVFDGAADEWVLADWEPCTHYSQLNDRVQAEYLSYRPSMGQPIR
jgi:hypothetical protein